MFRCLARRAEFIDEAQFQGRLFLVDPYPCAVPSEDSGDVVLGEVYRLRNPGRTLAMLDEYEGCGLGVTDAEYRRGKALVTLTDSATVATWIYTYCKPTRGLKRIRSGDFRQFARQRRGHRNE